MFCPKASRTIFGVTKFHPTVSDALRILQDFDDTVPRKHLMIRMGESLFLVIARLNEVAHFGIVMSSSQCR